MLFVILDIENKLNLYMSLFTETQLRSRVRNQITKGGSPYDTLETRAKSILKESLNNQRLFSNTDKEYDIFLSHSTNDAELVAGLKLQLEDLGHVVYVDWIEDAQLDRTNVNKATAELLQKRMKSCKSLIYAFSENARESRWMPWELGYFDGIKGKVAVLPISKTSKSDFKGTEFVGMYYYIQIDTISGTDKLALWVYENSTKYIMYTAWLFGREPIQR